MSLSLFDDLWTEGGKRRQFFPEIRHPALRLEPLPVFIEERDIGDGDLKQPGCEPHYRVEALLARRVEQPQRMHGLEPRLFVVR